jgi:hypothetical protein
VVNHSDLEAIDAVISGVGTDGLIEMAIIVLTEGFNPVTHAEAVRLLQSSLDEFGGQR